MKKEKLYYILSHGFSKDCENLIVRWLKAQPKTYTTFTKLWKEMSFGNVYHGKKSFAELIERCEEIINIAKYYMAYPSTNMEESIAGLFIVYGLIALQPIPDFVPVRVTPYDLIHMKKLLSYAYDTKRLDVVYIMMSVMIKGPIFYTVEERPTAFDDSYVKYYNGNVKNSERFSVTRHYTMFKDHLQAKALFHNLNLQMNEYINSKCQLPGFQRTKEDKETMLESALSEMKKAFQIAMNATEQISLPSSRRKGKSTKGQMARKLEEEERTLSELKHRALTSKVGRVKFLQSVQEPQPSTSTAGPYDATAGPSGLNTGADWKAEINLKKRKRYCSSSDSDLDNQLNLGDMNLDEQDEMKQKILVAHPTGEVLKVEYEPEIKEEPNWNNMEEIFNQALSKQPKESYRMPKTLIVKGKMKRLGTLEVAGYSEYEYLTRNERNKLKCQAESIRVKREAKKSQDEPQEVPESIEIEVPQLMNIKSEPREGSMGEIEVEVPAMQEIEIEGYGEAQNTAEEPKPPTSGDSPLEEEQGTQGRSLFMII
ncbi:hypothetical protein ACJJTC_017526 [Scirpophaga incertulas]